jgi:SH3-like domain-containing protein
MAAVQTTAPVFSNAAVTGSAVVAEALNFRGYPYSYTGDSPATGFSCIGFVWYVYHELGMNIPGSNPAAYQAYQQVSESNLEPGDLVFFQGTDPGLFPSHVAIYIGGGKIIAADNPSYGVTISSLVNDPRDGNYWQDHYLSAERPWTGSSISTPSTPTPVRHHHHVLIVIVSSLNLRSGPSMAYSVLTVLSRGTRVRVEGWTPAWVRVATAGGTVGWVLRAGVSRAGGYQPRLGRHLQSRHRLSAATRHYIWASAKTVYVYSLRVHSAPSLSAPVVLNLAQGNRVGIVARDGIWDKILTARGVSGWSLAQYLGRHRFGEGSTARVHHRAAGRGFHNALRAGVNIRSLPSMQASVLTVSDGNPVRILQWTSGWAKVQLSNGTIGWVSRIFLGAAIRNLRATGQPRSSQRRSPAIVGGHAVTAGVRIHTGPSLTDSVESYTTAGMRVRILGYESGFAHVETSSGIQGWIEEAYVAGTAARSVTTAVTRVTQTPGTGAYATSSVRLHATPSIAGAVIGVLYPGARLSILRTGLFDYVRLSTGQTGWVDASYIAG